MLGMLAADDWAAASAALESGDTKEPDSDQPPARDRVDTLVDVAMACAPLVVLFASRLLVNWNSTVFSIGFLAAAAWLLANLAITRWGDQAADRLSAVKALRDLARR
jgi:hypothetical protein